eukprot:4526783-Amphidinium_carterae.1
MEILQHIERLGGFDMPEIEVEIAYMRPKLDDVLLQDLLLEWFLEKRVEGVLLIGVVSLADPLCVVRPGCTRSPDATQSSS